MKSRLASNAMPNSRSFASLRMTPPFAQDDAALCTGRHLVETMDDFDR
jgi:hypothetical protein